MPNVLPKRVQAKFWRSERDTEPVKDDLRALSKADKKIIGQNVMTMELGWPIGMPTCRPMGAGLYEIRSTISGNREHRILFCIEEKSAVLLHAFVKKTRTTPKAELDIAIKRMRALMMANRKANRQ